MIVTCHGCGRTFEARRSDAKWCSDKCRKRVKRGVESIRTCPICGNKFDDLTGGRQYCSDECSEWARELDQRHDNIGKYDYLDADGEDDPWDSLD